MRVSVCCLTQGPWPLTAEERQHHAALLDAAAQQLAAGQFPLVFRGICAPTLQEQPANNGTQGSGLLQF